MEHDSCRICLSKTQTLERQDLFLEENNDLSVLGQLYEEVLNIPITNGKAMLRYICNSCGLQLKLFKQLKNKALESYLFFNDLLNDNNCVKNVSGIEENENFETNDNTNDTDKLSSILLKEEYFLENEDNNSIAEYIDCQDNDQQEIDGNVNNISENEIPENEMTENCIIENLLDENEHETVDDILRQIEDQKGDEEENEVELELEGDVGNLVDQEDNCSYTSDDQEYEICYLDEEIIQENSDKETEEQEYDEHSLIEEEFINENDIQIPESFHCPHCDEKFKLKSQLKNHKGKMHPTTIKFQCSVCNKALFSEVTYQAHMNVHNGLPAYQCHICEKTFNQKVHYDYHILNHKNERNIICNLCQKRFISKGDLKTHMRCHTDERRFKCEICDKKFRANTHLVNHRYSHFEKQFECPECFQKYMSPNTLRTHYKAVHKAEVPFQCEFCEKRFKRKHHLQAHYKTHSKTMDNISILEE